MEDNSSSESSLRQFAESRDSVLPKPRDFKADIGRAVDETTAETVEEGCRLAIIPVSSCKLENRSDNCACEDQTDKTHKHMVKRNLTDHAVRGLLRGEAHTTLF